MVLTPHRAHARARFGIAFVLLLLVYTSGAAVQTGAASSGTIDVTRFRDSAHHWHDVKDETYVIDALPGQGRYPASDIVHIADNILLYQKVNGGWPKNYDMQAVLTDEQKSALAQAVSEVETTTFDNGATHSHVAYLAAAYTRMRDERYKSACMKGIEFILAAQYANGGWPQFYPAAEGYARHITFNDGAMIGIMTVLRGIVRMDSDYAFIDAALRTRVRRAFDKGIDCILNCQIREGGRLNVWCQQHDEKTLLPQSARTFEPACISNQESAEITEFLMTLEHPDARIRASIDAAYAWFTESMIRGIRVAEVSAPEVTFQYHTSRSDRVVVEDRSAPPIWPRFTELATHRALFSNRNWKKVYSLAEVDRERRTGYAWYTYAPKRIVQELYPAWKKKL